MNLLEFLFKLINHFVPIDKVRSQQLQAGGERWYNEISVEKDETGEPVTVLSKLKHHGETWYFQTFLAVLYIFAVRWIHDFMNPQGEEDDNI